MTATSVELAIRNQTQVERLGAETRIHILAVVKPRIPSSAPPSSQPQMAFSCPEITYPLGAGPQPLVNRNFAPSDAQSHGPVHQQPDFDLVQSVISNGNATGQSSGSPQWPSKEIAERDRKAVRTFNILKMPEVGYNPWDLGSSRLNWETVMGYSVLDWLLPIKRSPCCEHEETESYYQVGPMVDLLRSKYGLIKESEIRMYGGRRRTELQGEMGVAEDTKPVVEIEGQDGHRKRRRRKSHREQAPDSTTTHQSTEMTDLSGATKSTVNQA
jgi:palmitoyltransferase